MSGESFYPHRQGPVGYLLDPLDGLEVPGGCDDCDAYQTVDATQRPVYRIAVHHDETCPAYRALKERQP
jgi:hypothetical protein